MRPLHTDGGDVPSHGTPVGNSVGSYLRRERERKHISVAELSQTTRIPVSVLLQIEEDRREELPADVFVRGFLRAYSRALGLDEEHVLARYGRTEVSDAPPSLPVVYPPDSGRRFGIAIALFILLILFTLALSIVLRPRHRDTPVELSQGRSPCAVEVTSAKHSSCAASTTATPTASSRC
ncbi:MAG: helix-turn-helix domain-containing protein [Myxococcales bacterium]|nr:helix-turn-helix domain-containing protein [Myxococcales bacterium]